MLKTTCYKKTFANIKAVDSLNMLNEKFYCLVYSPRFCKFSSPDKIPDIPDIFEMRCFNENFELRWTKNISGDGDAVLISENLDFGLNIDIQSSGEFYKRKSKYLLWGTTINTDSRTFLFEHRTGKFEIPLNLDSGKKVFLNFDEFFSPDPKHGNMIWRFERLSGLCAGE